jgi:hypothetical protein
MLNQIFDDPFAGQPASARDNHSLGHASHSLIGESRLIYSVLLHQHKLCRILGGFIKRAVVLGVTADADFTRMPTNH